MPLQATSGAASYDAFGGGVVAGPTYIEDVFSTFLYVGNNSTQTITNGIDLAGKGGMVWIKSRNNTSASTGHALFDTVRGRAYGLASQTTAAQIGPSASSSDLSSFNSTGFTVAGNNSWALNISATYASWTFREQPKFFDVVTYTGTGSIRTIAHNLGSTPGCIMVKRTDTTGDWYVYHNGFPSASYYALLNTTGGLVASTAIWANTAPTSSVFSVGTGATNTSGGTYVAYLFAHDAGGFGLTGTDNVISCGSYAGNSSTVGPIITLGYEPQLLIIKDVTSTNNWLMLDNMRGLPITGSTMALSPNLADAENPLTLITPTATGFQPRTTYDGVNAIGRTYIYIAIRRGPMKVPTDATKVFQPNDPGPAGGSTITTNFPVDAQIVPARKDAVHNTYAMSRLQGVDTSNSGSLFPYLLTNTTDEERTSASVTNSWSSTGYAVPTATLNSNAVFYSLRRAPGFFDEVCYTGTGSNRTVAHNLTVVPELMIVKMRSDVMNWVVYAAATGNAGGLYLNTTAAYFTENGLWNDTTPTSAVFSLGNRSETNQSASTYVAYLFATCAGVSKVGSYTGTGTTKQVDCGFTGGARFVLIKRTDSTGDWYVWDSARGIVAGNDPYLLLNSTAAEVTSTDYVDTYSAGFEISSTAPAAINASGGTFIFLAIA